MLTDSVSHYKKMGKGEIIINENNTNGYFTSVSEEI
jgi:hypothetical protein